MYLKLEKISKKFGAIAAISEIDLELKQGELVSILGENGSGKTTLLKVLAGTIAQNTGHIYYKNKCIDGIPANVRGFTMVWQQKLLFPHLSVYENVAFGLRIRGVKKKEEGDIVSSSLRLLGIESKTNARISELSGGQSQRVAIARALVTNPEVLLLDEPFTSLDPQASKHLRDQISKLRDDLQITIIMVTHSTHNAMLISDRLVVLKDGEIQQDGSPIELYNHPRSKYVASFFGKANFFDGTIEEIGDDEIAVKTAIGLLHVSRGAVNEYETRGKPVTLFVRADTVKTSRVPQKNTTLNIIRSHYKFTSVAGSLIFQNFLLIDGSEVVVEAHTSSIIEKFRKNEEVLLSWEVDQTRILV